MYVIGEQLNATRELVRRALAERDEKYVIGSAERQTKAGADCIDVNGGDGRPGMEAQNIEWMIDLVQAHTDRPIAIDSSSPEVVAAGLKRVLRRPIVNSISLRADNLDAMMALVAGHDCMVVALCMSDSGVPSGVDDRLHLAGELIDRLVVAGKAMGDIIIDPCFLPVVTEPEGVLNLCRAVARIRAKWPGVLVGGGVSNGSYGLPARKWVNFSILTLAICHGMNAGIVDPCAPGVVAAIRAAEAVCGSDEFCANYIQAFREGQLA